jgi:hypothetical protein
MGTCLDRLSFTVSYSHGFLSRCLKGSIGTS